MSIKRIAVLDIAKGLGICMVVIGHTLSPLKSFVYLFHVPTFFLISGFLYKDDIDISTLFKKRLKGLYVPVIKYSAVIILLHNVFFKLGIYDSYIGKYYHSGDFVNQILKLFAFSINSTEPLLAGFWFLKSLFIVEFIFYGINKAAKLEVLKIRSGTWQLAIIFLLLVIVWTINIKHISYPGYLNTTLIIPLIALLFYYLGGIYKKHQHLIKFNIPGLIISFGLLVLASFYINIDLKAVVLPNPILYYAISLTGIYFTLCVSHYIDKLPLKNLLVSVGENTIAILGLHFLAFKVVSIALIYAFHLSFDKLVLIQGIDIKYCWIVYATIGVIVPLIVIAGGNKLLMKKQISL